MISLIVAHYPINPDLDEKLKWCLDSLTGYDELVLVINDGIGFGKAFNWGMKYAKGDYLFVVSNDTYLLEGNLKDLCNPNAVTTPVKNNMKQEFNGCFFVLPKWVYEKIGGFDEQFKVGYFEDDDYIMRLREAGIPMQCVESVKIATEGGRTMEFLDKATAYNENRVKFIKKWKVDSSNPIVYE